MKTSTARKTRPPAIAPARWRSFAVALRPHQWTKNLLVFVPIVMAQQEQDPIRRLEAVFTFFAFCLVASAVYLMNDVADAYSDRQHVDKRRRPFASGALPPVFAWVAAPLFAAAGVTLGWFIHEEVGTVLGVYLVANLAYSFYLKLFAMLDVLMLAVFYCLRLYAGAWAVHVEVSAWLLTFSLFLFCSLALAKRVSELSGRVGSLPGRGYVAADRAQLMTFGIVSGYLSVLVYALFAHSPHVGALYARPLWLWAVVPLLFYGISRVWLYAGRGEMHSDPLVHALSDRASYLLLALAALSFALARNLL